MTAAELVYLIGATLNDYLSGARDLELVAGPLDDGPPGLEDGPLFATLRVVGPDGHFAVTVEEVLRSRSSS